MLNFLGRRIVWFRKRQYSSVIEELGPVDSHSDCGHLKITFYFYQAADLLIVDRDSAEELLHKIPFVLAIVDAFNFHVRSLHRVIDCPLAGLTAVTKERLLSGTVFLTMAELVVIYGLHVAFHKIRREEKPSPIHYMAVVIEVLLPGYERLAESSLKLMHCFSIGSEKRLFIDAGFFVGNGGSIYYLLMLLCLSYLSSLFFIVAPPSFTTPQFLQKNSSELAYYHCHFWCIGCSSRRLTEMLNPTKTERAAKTFWKCCMARFVNPAIMITEHSIGRAF